MACLIAFLAVGSADAATLIGGDYAGADLIPADGDKLEGTFTNVGTFHVAAGIEVDVKNHVPLVVEADNILIEGLLDGHAAGFDGGLPSEPGKGPGGGRGCPGGGGGHGGWGGFSGVSEDAICGVSRRGKGGSVYGTHDDPLDAPPGSGGGACRCGADGGDFTRGGDGGGSITLRADVIVITPSGRVSVAGGRGQDVDFDFDCNGGPGHGGGSGGSLVLDAAVSAQVDGLLSARGGAGGDARSTKYDEAGGGGGAGGRVKVYGPIVGDLHPPDVEGRDGGDGSDFGGETGCSAGWKGGLGTVYVDALVTGPPSLTVTGSCGSVETTVTGGTPFGQVQLITGTAAGSDPLPVRSICEGLATGLTGLVNEGMRVLDETGSLTLSGVGPDCGVPLQVIDLWSCTASPVVTLP